MKVFSNDTLIPTGLVLTIIAGALAVGASFNQIEANAEDIDALDERTKVLETTQTRGLILQENLNTLQAQQARTQEGIEELLQGHEQRMIRLEILIERLSRESGTMDGR